jgi:hypothetical protein
MFLLKSVKLELEWANKILVLSAKIIGAEALFIMLGKSFMLIGMTVVRWKRTKLENPAH